jgi:hypothetical protein
VPHREHLSPKEFADGVLLQALAAGLPETDFRAEIFPGPYTMATRVEGRDAAEAGKAAAERLGQAAAQVRAAELPADLPEWQGSGPAIRLSRPASVPVFPLQCFSWIDAQGEVRTATPADLTLPAPVAEAAVAAGFADSEGTMASRRAKEAWDNRFYDSGNRRLDVTREQMLERVEVADLGVNLKEAQRLEEQRQRAEWQAAQAAQRAELERKAA